MKYIYFSLSAWFPRRKAFYFIIMNQLLEIIKTRRTIKPIAMNGNTIDDALVEKCLEAANWAPTHGRTEPWRFVVYSGDATKRFCEDHATLYKANTPEEEFVISKYESIKNQALTISHIVIAMMKRTEMTKIPFLEEYAAVSASVQNILLMAHAQGIATIWSTGGMLLHPAMKEYFQLKEQDEVLGAILMGYTDNEPKEGTRKTDFKDKIIWNR
jgi:nitroreductase